MKWSYFFSQEFLVDNFLVYPVTLQLWVKWSYFFFQEFLYLVLLVTSVGFYWFLFGRFAPFLLRLKFILVIVWFWKSICYSFEELKRMNTSLWEIDHRKYKYQGCYCGVRSSINVCWIKISLSLEFVFRVTHHKRIDNLNWEAVVFFFKWRGTSLLNGK